jgi:hypothetical protein
MKRIALWCALLAVLSPLAFSQNITNTLGVNGEFKVEDGSTDFLTISQIGGHASFSNNITIAASTTASLGIIFKGPNRFIHDFKKSGTSGDNTFLGVNTGNFTMTGASSGDQASQNTATGYSTLTSLTTGKRNQAFGYRTLFTNNSGQSNSAFGDEAMYANTSGSSNAAIGGEALYSNQSGSYNSAVGVLALTSNTASYNTAIGYSAGSDVTSGSNNTAIGYDAEVPSGSSSNQVRIGNTSVSYAGVQVAWTTTSDKRWKSNIVESNLGLEFISKINPVSYARKNDEKERTEYGFIAQEIEEVLKEEGAGNSGMVTVDDQGRYELRYNDLLAPMVKAIQELNEEVLQLKATQAMLLKENSRLRAENETQGKEN